MTPRSARMLRLLASLAALVSVVAAILTLDPVWVVIAAFWLCAAFVLTVDR